MPFTFLLCWLWRCARHHAGSIRPAGPRQHAAAGRLGCERLEDRTVPSTLTVLTSADRGSGSLRAILAAAHDGDTIIFARHLQGGPTITLASQLTVSKSVDIEGPGAAGLTISGNDHTRVFEIDGGAAVTIAGLTVAHGLTNTPSDSSNADENPAIQGGGLRNDSGAYLTLRHCILLDNQAVGGDADLVVGGALVNQGNAMIAGCTFLGNQARGGESVGGAIENVRTLAVTDSTFTGNLAVATLATGFANGGAVDNTDGQETLTDSTFSANEAIGSGPGTEAAGGAVMCFDDVSVPVTLTIANCILTANKAVGGAGGDGVQAAGFAQGGAMDNNGGQATVIASVFTDNQAVAGAMVPGATASYFSESNSGAIKDDGAGSVSGFSNNITGFLVVADSVFIGNQAIAASGNSGTAGSEGDGGAITVLSGPLTIAGSTFLHNSAQGGDGGSGAAGGAGVGGAVDITALNTGGGSVTATLADNTFTDNEAHGGAGGAGADGGAGIGGAVTAANGVLFGVTDAASLVLGGSMLVGNVAVGGDAGADAAAGSGLGGALAILGAASSVAGSAFVDNLALGGDGGTGGNGLGGGIAIAAGATLGVSDTTIAHNRAQGGEAIAAGSDGQGIGGGVDNLGTFTFDRVTLIRKNRASTSSNDLFT